MTCIAAVTDGETVWMGGDSLILFGFGSSLSCACSTEQKVFTRHDAEGNVWIFGSSGSARRGQVIRHNFTPPVYPHNQGASTRKFDTFLAKDFIPLFQKTLSAEDKRMYRPRRKHKRLYTKTLVGIGGELFVIEHWNYYVFHRKEFAAIGSGGLVATGALYATAQTDHSPQERILLALEAAEAFNAGVRRPFSIASTDENHSEIEVIP